MNQSHTDAGARLTDLILQVFELNGALLEAGNALVRDIGLTSARWQVLGAVAMTGTPLSVAQIARRMGLSRQAVQRVVNDLYTAGLVDFADNPDHKRAVLVVLTEAGRAAYQQAEARQIDWSNRLSEGLAPDQLTRLTALLSDITHRCKSTSPTE